MNGIRQHTEDRNSVCIASDPQIIIRWYNEQLCEPYQEQEPSSFSPGEEKTYYKSFKKGGPLEYFNPLDSFEPNYYGQGIIEIWT
jgi:hypothetical protein